MLTPTKRINHPYLLAPMNPIGGECFTVDYNYSIERRQRRKAGLQDVVRIIDLWCTKNHVRYVVLLKWDYSREIFKPLYAKDMRLNKLIHLNSIEI